MLWPRWEAAHVATYHCYSVDTLERDISCLAVATTLGSVLFYSAEGFLPFRQVNWFSCLCHHSKIGGFYETLMLLVGRFFFFCFKCLLFFFLLMRETKMELYLYFWDTCNILYLCSSKCLIFVFLVYTLLFSCFSALQWSKTKLGSY